MMWGEINDFGQVVGYSETAVPDPNGDDAGGTKSGSCACQAQPVSICANLEVIYANSNSVSANLTTYNNNFLV